MDSVNISIGAGSGYNSAVIGKNGANTIVGEITANGGHGGGPCSGGDGGSGGGGGAYYMPNGRDEIKNLYGTTGASDGGSAAGRYIDIFGRYYVTGGKGQGTTTRAFGESEGTLYSGGGGGCGQISTPYCGYGLPGGAGGGGGGNGLVYDSAYQTASFYHADAGVTNTGGGGGGGDNPSHPAAAGGSGIAIIRWGY